MLTGDHDGAFVLAVAVLVFASLPAANAQERTVDPAAVSTRTCQALIIDSVDAEYPKLKNIEWDMDSVRETDTPEGVRLTGEGRYKGGSSRWWSSVGRAFRAPKRTFDFECTFSSKRKQVVSAWWVSSFDRQRHIVVSFREELTPTQEAVEPERDSTGMEQEGDSGWSLAQITRVCRNAVRDLVRDEFPGKVRKLDFIYETIEHSEDEARHELSGKGRLQGGGGTWRLFTFECSFDEDSKEVTATSWQHLGVESDLESQADEPQGDL